MGEHDLGEVSEVASRRSKRRLRGQRRLPLPPENWNPYRTPGISLEDQSPFSPAGRFDNGYVVLRRLRVWLDERPMWRFAWRVSWIVLLALWVFAMTTHS